MHALPSRMLCLGKPLLNTLENNNVSEAKNVLQQLLNSAKEEVSKKNTDNETYKNMLRTSNTLDQRLKQVKPCDENSMEDIKKILQTLLVFIQIYLGGCLSSIFSPLDGVTEGAGKGLGCGFEHLRKGDLLGAITGASTNGLYGLIDGLINGQFSSVYTGLTLLSFQTENCIQNNDRDGAKQGVQQYTNELKKAISNEKMDDETHNNLIKTVNAIDKKLKQVKPRNKGSLEDIKDLFQIGLFTTEIAVGFMIGVLTAPIDGLINAIQEALNTGSCRLKKGDIFNTLTGAVASGSYGLANGAVNSFYKGFRSPLNTCT